MKRSLIALALACTLNIAYAQTEAPRPPAPTLSKPKGTALTDARGFIPRWLVLEPVSVPGRLTESAVEEALAAAALPEPGAALPRDGDTANIGGATQKWHALDTHRYNLNLYHFAWSLSKPTSNVLFWVVTTVDSPRDIPNARLAIGSNAASRWWLNGERVIALNDDRQAVIDDGVSRRLTLRKGRNVIRAAIVNGGGATDFCARFLDDKDQPIPGLAISF